MKYETHSTGSTIGYKSLSVQIYRRIITVNFLQHSISSVSSSVHNIVFIPIILLLWLVNRDYANTC